MNAIAFFILITCACALAGCLVRRVVPGPNAHFTNSLIAAGVSAFLCGRFGPGSGLGLAGGVGSAVAVVGIVCCDWWLHRRRIRKSTQAAHDIREFGLAKFDILDDDGDGLVSAVDLHRVSTGGRFKGADAKMLDRIVADLPLIGHWTPMPPYTAAMLRQVIDNPSHVITRGEFEHFPEKIRQVAERTFGESAV